jgi:modulator of FtsH protease
MFGQISQQGTMVQANNKVLKNVYGLLALSMLPTILGAWIGISTSIMAGMSMGVSAIVFLVFAFGMMFLINRNKESSLGVGLLLFFTFGMGLFLSRLLGPVLGLQQGAGIVMTSFFGTAVVFGVMTVLSSMVKKDVSSLYKAFIVGAVVLMVVSLSNLFFQSSVLMMVVSAMAIIIFSGLLFFELKSVRDGYETNYVMATLSIYLSVYNIFTSLVQLLTGFSLGDD